MLYSDEQMHSEHNTYCSVDNIQPKNVGRLLDLPRRIYRVGISIPRLLATEQCKPEEWQRALVFSVLSWMPSESTKHRRVCFRDQRCSGRRIRRLGPAPDDRRTGQSGAADHGLDGRHCRPSHGVRVRLHERLARSAVSVKVTNMQPAFVCHVSGHHLLLRVLGDETGFCCHTPLCSNVGAWLLAAKQHRRMPSHETSSGPNIWRRVPKCFSNRKARK